MWTLEQSEAINKEGSNIIVSAGAGSGKTAVISERVIRKLKEGIHINRLLILTFTKAAAKEMKDRIKSKIKEDVSLIEELPLLNTSYITTFDSYSYSIVKKYHYLLGLSNNIKIEEGNIVKIETIRILNSIFDELYEKEDEQFINFIYTYCLKDDTEIKKAIIKLNDKLDLKYDKLDYLKNYMGVNYSDIVITNDINKYFKMIRNKQVELDKKISLLDEYDINEYVNTIRDLLNPYLETEDYLSLKEMDNIKLPNIPRNSGVSGIKKEITNLISNIVSLCSYENKEEIKSMILETKEYVRVIVNILITLEERINKYKLDKELFTFNDIAKKAIYIVKNNDDIRNELKNYFNEIMVDEYQDTSDLQEEFIKLLENNNVYMVGDIKQSIYRFRNANPYIFKKKYDLYKQGIGGYKIDLNKNFRSRKETLDNINSIFNLIMTDEIGGADYVVDHKMIFGNNAYLESGNNNLDNNVEILNYELDKESDYNKAEIEIFSIANDIKNKINNNYKVMDKDTKLTRNITYEDIVILMDKGKDFVLYKKIFEYLGIPLTIYRDDSITNNINIILIKNIINVCDLYNKKLFNEDFKHNFMSLGRSYLFEYDDNTLFNMIKNNSYDSSLLDNIKTISSILDKTSISEVLESIVNVFDINNKLIKIGDIEENITVLDYLLNISFNLESIGYNIYDFSLYLNDLLDNELDIKMFLDKESSNSVRIMTIHGSKGLEYSICYYSGLSNDFNIREVNDKIILGDNIIIPVYNKGYRNTIYKEMYKYNYLKEEVSEKIRLFYVALTRTREKMIIVASIKDNDMLEDRTNYRSFKDILDSTKSHLESYIKNIDITSLGLTKNYNFSRKVDNKIIDDEVINVSELITNNKEVESLRFSKNEIKLSSAEELNNMKMGIEIHHILESIDFKNPNYDSLEINSFYKTKIGKFLNSDLFKDYINIYKEFEFMYKEDNIYHGFIDLIIEYKDYIMIVDYKLKHTEDNAYLKQIEGYKNYLARITNKKIEYCLYSILDEKIINY